ncbi:MAG: zinc-binding dehydrogenase [Candidatus Eremiobacteraeota bacterium]|nr:zinc-binding dehydrogenase [Candidatus Eremiobacteraeota bacterium]MBV8584572.1 zinc-binding dehydrogenase [Candidatus Eremiobacteraeota bacterium]MBV8655122.1 zinc-binding dehydrogenase [Candidatus Eremiobacteraeota bacterium]
MKALQFARFGEPADVVALSEIPKPEPGSGEVRVRVRLAPIHNHDLATIRGIYGVKPPLPAIGGSESAGVVDALGEGVDGIAVGTRVALGARGTWTEYVTLPAASLLPVPPNVPDEIAAQLVAMPLSAVVLLDELRVRAGDWIVQNAANGAVGRTLMRAAQKAGINVINLVRRESAAEELRSFGAQHAVVQEGKWAERVRDIAGTNAIARVVDSLCDQNSIALNRLLGPGGEHVVFGALGKSPLSVDPGALIFGQTVVRGFWMIAWMTSASESQRRDAIGRCVAMAAAGELALAAASVHPFSEAAEALREAESPGRSGKVLLQA